jgi:hypothetical protein
LKALRIAASRLVLQDLSLRRLFDRLATSAIEESGRDYAPIQRSAKGRFCCKTLCCAANAQLSNPRSRHLESDIARFGSSLNQYCASEVSKIVLQQYRPIPDIEFADQRK